MEEKSICFLSSLFSVKKLHFATSSHLTLGELEKEKHLSSFLPLLYKIFTFCNFHLAMRTEIFLFGLENWKRKRICFFLSLFSPKFCHFVTSSYLATRAGKGKGLAFSFPFLSKIVLFCNCLAFGCENWKRKSISLLFPFSFQNGYIL